MDTILMGIFFVEKQESITRKCLNHIPQTNPRHFEEEIPTVVSFPFTIVVNIQHGLEETALQP